jgi:hypothetical protein
MIRFDSRCWLKCRCSVKCLECILGIWRTLADFFIKAAPFLSRPPFCKHWKRGRFFTIFWEDDTRRLGNVQEMEAHLKKLKQGLSIKCNSNILHSSLSKSPIQNVSLSSKRSSRHCLWPNCFLPYAVGLLRLCVRNGKLNKLIRKHEILSQMSIYSLCLSEFKLPFNNLLWHIISCACYVFW